MLLFTILPTPGRSSGHVGALAADDFDRRDVWRTLAGRVGRLAAPSAEAILFSRGGELQTTWFDAERLAITGASPAVVSPLSSSAAGAHFAVSSTGALLTGGPHAESASTYAWIGGDAPEAAIDLDRELDGASLSRDGNRLAGVDSVDGARTDVWVADLRRGATSRVTIGANAVSPIWCGATLFYAARDRGLYEIWRKDPESPDAPPARIHSSTTHAFPVALTADGKMLAFRRRGLATKSDLWLLALDGGQVAALVQTPFEEGAAAFAPDGGLLAYESSEAGRWDIHILRLSDRKRVVVSRSGGSRPHWSRDGSALYYQVGRDVMRVPFEWRGDEARIGPPTRVADVGEAELIAVDRTGRALVRRPPLQPTSVTVALHWVRDLRAILGPPPPFLPR